jgi:hypothetical protein
MSSRFSERNRGSLGGRREIFSLAHRHLARAVPMYYLLTISGRLCSQMIMPLAVFPPLSLTPKHANT